MISRTAIRRFPGVLSAVSAGRVAPTIVHRTLATPATPPSPNDPFANGTNAYYAEEMYRHWKQDPKSVHASWHAYFSGMEYGLPSAKAFQPPPGLIAPPADGTPALYAGGGAELDDHLKVRLLLFCCCVAYST
jgi:2-oxoglutarate dehydrogenase E1 component